jgi:hypothetical protein
MRALVYISILPLFVMASCSSTQYAGREYDDLYYSSADNVPVKNQVPVNEKVGEKNLSVNDYYDNKYAVDTLVSDQFYEAAQPSDQVIINNYGGYDYYNSYSGRLQMFYGNYFDPYWNDPYYFSFNYGYPYSGIGFGFGYPYFSIGFNWGWGYPYYGGYYPYYPPYYGGYYPGYCCGYYPGYGYEDSYVNYGRRERPSELSSKANNSAYAGGSSRRDASVTSRANSSGGGRSYSDSQIASSSVRRNSPGSGTGVSKSIASGRTNNQDTKVMSARSGSSSQQGPASSRPEYKSSNRTYLPSYNNPRMSTRPSYNTSRTIGSELGNRGTSGNSSRYQSGSSSNPGSSYNTRSNAPTIGGQKSSSSHSGNAIQYSMPSRRSSDGGSYSSGSYNRSSSGYSRSSGSSGSGSRSYSSGSSSYSGGGSSFSGGGSSSGSSSRGSSGSSSGRR